MEPSDQYGDGGGSFSDWMWSSLHKDTYIILKDGTVFMLQPLPETSQQDNPYHWSAFGAAYDSTKAAGKCTWAKNYTAN